MRNYAQNDYSTVGDYSTAPFSSNGEAGCMSKAAEITPAFDLRSFPRRDQGESRRFSLWLHYLERAKIYFKLFLVT